MVAHQEERGAGSIMERDCCDGSDNCNCQHSSYPSMGVILNITIKRHHDKQYHEMLGEEDASILFASSDMS
jgi:hypothetical protein